MNAKKLAIIAITALVATATSFAETGKDGLRKQMPNRAQIVSSMIANHDENQDGALNSTELASSIESLYGLRQKAIRDHRDAMLDLGRISEYEASNGIITLSLMPEDGAAILMSGPEMPIRTKFWEPRSSWSPLVSGTHLTWEPAPILGVVPK